MADFFGTDKNEITLEAYQLRQEMLEQARKAEEAMWNWGFDDSQAGRMPRFTSGSYKKGYDTAGRFRLDNSI